LPRAHREGQGTAPQGLPRPTPCPAAEAGVRPPSAKSGNLHEYRDPSPEGGSARSRYSCKLLCMNFVIRTPLRGGENHIPRVWGSIERFHKRRWGARSRNSRKDPDIPQKLSRSSRKLSLDAGRRLLGEHTLVLVHQYGPEYQVIERRADWPAQEWSDDICSPDPVRPRQCDLSPAGEPSKEPWAEVARRVQAGLGKRG